MDLNDPRRRLQVLNNTNPSIRIATAPQQQQTLSVAKPRQQQTISIAQPKTQQYNISVPEYQAPVKQKYKGFSLQDAGYKKLFGWEVGKYMGDFGKLKSINMDRDVEATATDFLEQYNKLGDEYRRNYVNGLIDKAKSGDEVAFNTAKLLQDEGKLGGTFSDFIEAANNKAFGWTMNGANFGHQNDKEKILDNFTAGQIGKEFDPITVGTDIGLTIAGGAGATKLLSKIPAVQRIIEAGGVGSKVIPFLADSVGAGITQEAISKARGRDTSFAQDIVTGTAIDTGANLLFKGAGRFVNLFRNGEKSASIVDDILKEADPSKIKEVMKVDDNLANYLANETNPDAVREVLKSLELDPNIKLPDAVRERLQEEGISAVRMKDNPYGAQYNKEDRSIDVKDQSYATDANMYHEMSHDIFVNKLTPEEKALIAKYKGRASAEATGRPGYTADDLTSEDFSDYMQKAMTGRLNEVPEELKSVISKYAKVAAEEGGQKLLPAITKSTQDIPSGLGDGFVFADKGTRGLRGITDSIDKIDKKLSDIQMGKIASNRDEIAQLQAERQMLINKAQEPFNFAAVDKANGVVTDEQAVAKRVDEISKAQAGTSDAQVTGSGQVQNTLGDSLAGKVDNLGGDGGQAVAKSGDNVPLQRAEQIVPEGTDPNITKAVQNFLDNLNAENGTLDQAQAGYDAAAKARSVERAQRIQAGGGAYETAGGGEAGFQAKLGSLRGKLTESGYTPISVDPQTEKVLLDSVENSKLMDYEKLNTQNALRKVWGANPDKPTPSDLQYIRRHFNDQFGDGVGDEVAKGIEEQLKSGRSMADIASEISGLPRSLMATGDLSGGFRQALPLGTRFPKEWANANKLSVEWAFQPQKYEAAMREIADSPNYNVIADKMGVDLSGVGAMKDEAFIGSGLAESIPIAGQVVKGADRAYTGVLTKLRYDVANGIVEKAGGAEKFLKNMEEVFGDAKVKKGIFFGKGTVSKADRAMRAYGEFINTFSGRGGMKGGMLDNNMQTLSATLFAPRLWAANVNRLNPAWYARMFRDNPEAAKLAMQSQGTFMLMAGSVLGLAAMAGAKVGTDPRSADFGKIRVGNTRYDILGGQQQNIVQFARQWTGEKVNSETGEVDKLGDGYGAKTRFDLAFDMFENKSNPLVAFGINLMQTADGDTGNWLQDQLVRKDQYGNEFNVGEKVARMGIPLGLQGAYDTSQDVGDPVKGTLLNAPSFFGVGVQTYGTNPTKDKVSVTDGKVNFGGKVTEDMVLDNNGNPLVDDKGSVVRVKFPKDATELEKKAMLDEKRRSALKDTYMRSLSSEDRALMKMSDEELQRYVDNGMIDQNRFDSIKNMQQSAENASRGDQYTDKDIKSDLGKQVYSKFKTMSKKDQDYWLSDKNPPEEFSKQIASELNRKRAEGISEFKPSNKLAKAYADYENDINSHPEYTTVDKQNKAKAFQVKAYKMNYTDAQSDIYNEGGSSDLKALIDNNKITEEDLAAAIKMDDELFASGLTGSLKFSKKFRNTYGYGVPIGSGGSGGVSFRSGGSGSSGGGSGGSKSAHLSDLLISTSIGNKSTPAPTFSSKPRTGGISFKDVNAPRKSNSKKVTINL